MTDKMSNALTHIQNAQDVDDWAKEIVTQKFVSYDALLNIMLEVVDNISDDGERSEGFKNGLKLSMGLILEVMK